jgi:hypothetical protein
MKLPLASAAIASILLFLAAATTFALDAATEGDEPCTGRAPFREVAQDELYTFDELCRMREDFLPADRVRPRGIGWAKARSSVPVR